MPVRSQLTTDARRAMRRLSTEIDGLDRRAAAHFGIGRTDLHIVDTLRFSGPTTPSELAAAVGLSSGGLSIALERLERVGYIKRSAHPADRRRVVVETTEIVDQVETEVFGPLGRRMRALFGRYSDDQLATIRDYLERTADAISQTARAEPTDDISLRP